MTAPSKIEQIHPPDQSLETQLDYLSNLPEPLTTFIISLLPIKEALRTSILAKKWRYKWTWINTIDFDRKSMKLDQFPCSFIPSVSSELARHLARTVDSVFSTHQGLIFTCRLSHYIKNIKVDYSQNCESDMSRWIDHLTQRGIQKLVLDCYDGWTLKNLPDNKKIQCELSHRVFCCESLRVVELNSCQLAFISPSIQCHSIISLKLSFVVLSDDSIFNLVRGCSNLETLVLKFCLGLQYLKIYSWSLRSIEFMMLDVKEIDINSPRLMALLMDTLHFRNGFGIYAPNLRVFRTWKIPKGDNYDIQDSKSYIKHENSVTFRSNMEVLARIGRLYGECSIRGSRHKMYTIPFEILHRLFINVNLKIMGRVIELAFLLRICLQLQELNIEIERDLVLGSIHPPLSYDHAEFWRNQDSFDCIAHHLKTVNMTGFTGHYLEVEFVRYLITNAPMIEKMSIRCHKDCSKQGAEATLDLLTLPRASLNINIVLKPSNMRSAHISGDFERWMASLK